MGALTAGPISPLVNRSRVPAARHYRDYKEVLRWDFFYSCAYCNTMEFEGQGIAFSIDHYLPQISYGALSVAYSNLMWSCGDCNSRKGDREVPREASDAGFRFFKADEDNYYDHFEYNSDEEIQGKTGIGNFTVVMLHLNRQTLRRIRAQRREMKIAAEAILDGMNALRRLPIDQLPTRSKGEALVRSQRALAAAINMQDRVDSLLRDFAHSQFVDHTPDDASAQQGRKDLQERLGAMFPGRYRGRPSRGD